MDKRRATTKTHVMTRQNFAETVAQISFPQWPLRHDLPNIQIDAHHVVGDRPGMGKKNHWEVPGGDAVNLTEEFFKLARVKSGTTDVVVTLPVTPEKNQKIIIQPCDIDNQDFKNSVNIVVGKCLTQRRKLQAHYKL